ncbi:Peptidase C39 family protein [Sporomusa ovata DSM 2662]|uniref:cysteine peptidase family C39 domain-containing protein n=1 Tax=Sporomusa ovata TaxID=2378 RepID=UPI00038889AA|nr:cysteine peptidase family C39 domain-containing protein [Sporomusa ovata]EQB27293.1 ABC-type bacteriocin/lantibiotic exporter [Sporomusa ovata DSM 2662]
MTTTPENITIPENRTRGCTHFIDVPLCRQETEYTCGVACLQSILGCYGFDYRQDELALILESKPKLGTDSGKMISFMKMIGFEASFIKNMSIDQLKSFIAYGITPMIQLQAWGDNGVDYASDWKDSHYVIACGYDGDRIFFMDPWTLGNYTYLTEEELLKRWHVPVIDFSRCSHCALIIKTEHFPFIYDPKAAKYLG